jgi:hypothetical protein
MRREYLPMTQIQTTDSTISSTDLMASLDLFVVKPGVRFDVNTLRTLLPDVETLLFFAKVYDLNATQLADLLHRVLKTDLTKALFTEGHEHSNELQDYLLDGYEDDDGNWHEPVIEPARRGDVNLTPDVPKGEILPEVWKSLEVVVATSIKEVAAKLDTVVARLPGKQGSMVFSSMMKLNARRPTIGDYRASIQHARVQENLLILDVSGSMNAVTVRRIIDDVVALSYQANAHMAIVSDQCTYWPAGAYSVDDVLAKATYGGTHYETLAPLFDRDWGTVITVADYDSSPSSKKAIARCKGRIDQVIDVSLVNKPTFLAEVVGQLASSVKPILIGSGHYVLT